MTTLRAQLRFMNMYTLKGTKLRWSAIFKFQIMFDFLALAKDSYCKKGRLSNTLTEVSLFLTFLLFFKPKKLFKFLLMKFLPFIIFTKTSTLDENSKLSRLRLSAI